MQIDINAIIEIYARKLSDAEKENVLLQAQVMMLQKQLEELQRISRLSVEEAKQYKDDIRFAIVESDDELEYGFDISTYNKTVVEFTHDGKEVVQSEYTD